MPIPSWRSRGLFLGVMLFLSACRSAPAALAPARSNILLITVDTWRADRINADVAPALDRLAASSVRFTSARSAVPLTLPSHTTILTGLLPPEHGVRENGIDALSDAHETTATILKSSGYRTAAFVGAFVLDRRFGLSQGFETYDDQIPRDPGATERLEAERPASVVIDHALAWLDRFAPGTGAPGTVAPGTLARSTLAPGTVAPFFIWIHLYDPHAPYTPPREFIKPPTDAATIEQRYEGEIRYADAQLGRLFAWLEAHRLRDKTMIVVAGDHGEGLGDHGERTHGMLLYDSTLRVPLIVSLPGAAAMVRNEPVSLRDIAPTMVRAAGVAIPAAMKGRDLAGTIRSRAPSTSTSIQTAEDDVYAETEYPRSAGWSPLQALTDGRWMAIKAGAATAVYDLQHDPREEHDVASAQPTIASAMASRIDVIHQRGGASASSGLSSDAAERLRALGYVASSAQTASSATGIDPSSKIDAWNGFEGALTALNARNTSAAVTSLSALVAANPDAPVFQTTLARALRQAGQGTRALEVYRRAARRWPTDALLLHDLAVAAREAAMKSSGPAAHELFDEAIRADRAALVLAPNSSTVHNGLGLMDVDRGRPQDAVKEFEQAARLDPNNASYWTNLGNALRALRDASGAERAYRRALEVDAGATDAVNGLGVLLVETRRPAEAVPLFERAIAAAPDFQEARLNLGIALQESGQAARAAEIYRQVLAGPPRYKREREAAAKLLSSLSTR